jgi:hypothetical protein
MFASSFRLDLTVILEPEYPRHIKSILSCHLPIHIDYSYLTGASDMTDSALWRMRVALGHRDRVREITFRGGGECFRKFIKAANHHLPVLESLDLCFQCDQEPPEIPSTFLRGPDRSDLPLRRLELYGGSIAFFVSGFLSSAKALTDLTLQVTAPDPAVFDPSQVSSLLGCLQGMQCLRNLDLAIWHRDQDLLSQDSEGSHHLPAPKDTAIVSMSGLTRFCYYGPSTFWNHFLSRLSAPSLQDVEVVLLTRFPLPYLSRVIDEVREEFRSVSVTYNLGDFLLLSSTHLGEIDHSKPSESSFKFKMNCNPHLINSTKLTMTEELTLNHGIWWGGNSSREFIRQFRSVRVLRVNPFVPLIGRYLEQGDDGEEAVLPVLEEIKVSACHMGGYEGYELSEAEVMAAFEPCKRVGPPVKVYYRQWKEMQYRYARSW